MNEFKLHDVEWTREKINNFWNYFVTNDGLTELSFARGVGKEIIKIVRPYLKKNGDILDYGCGGGYLMQYLLEFGFPCFGLDASAKSVSEVKEKFKGEKLFRGAIVSLGTPNKDILAESYDFVFIIETIEHLFRQELDEVLSEIYRILRPGGHIFITTPNSEKLDKYKVICPDCGCIFHRVQHLNSFTPDSLADLLHQHGFEKVFCYPTLLSNTENIFNRSKYLVNKFINRLYGKKIFVPELIYLGKCIKIKSINN